MKLLTLRYGLALLMGAADEILYDAGGFRLTRDPSRAATWPTEAEAIRCRALSTGGLRHAFIVPFVS